jgi:TPP-dependent pyruvate/acetoin dehydrogenase alpha subunit
METESLDIYQKLILIRRCQEKIISEYPRDEIKTPVHLGTGLEGIAVGVTHLLAPDTKTFGQLRNHGQYLALTGETDEYFGELYGKVTGTGAGKAGSMHLCFPERGLISTSGIVASTIPLAVGAALAAKYRGSNALALAMFGDAAIEEGEYWDCFNFACLHRLRILLVCEDNDLSIHTFGSQRRGFKSIAGAMRGFDCHVYDGDGTDVRTVMNITRTALAAMEREPKPAFLCLKWFRFLEHVGPNTDFYVGYRSDPDEETLRSLDPVFKYERYLLSEGIDPGRLAAIRQEVDAQIERSVAAAKAARYPTERELYEDLFA